MCWNGSRPVDPHARIHELSGLGLDGRTWGNGPGDRYAAHVHPSDNTLIALEGPLDLILPEEGQTLRLEIGDRLELAAGTVHAAVVVEQGVTGWEAQRLAGWDGGRS